MSENYKRFNLYGKDVTEDELRAHIVKLRLGDTSAKIAPLNPTDIAKKIGYTRQTVHNYLKKAESLNEIKIEDGKIVIDPKAIELQNQQDFVEFGEQHPILSDPYIKRWYDDMTNRKQGKGISISGDLLRSIEKLCNVLRVQPIQLLIDKETTEQIKRNFLDAYKSGKVPNSKPESNIQGIDYRWSYAIASFCGANGKNWWARGSSTMSRKVVGHGKYADERLTPEQFVLADNHLKTKHGIDSDIFRVFWGGIETCARHVALTSMTLEHTKHTSAKTGKVTYFMTATESKTAHIKDGKWTKYITRPDLQKSIDMALARGQTKLVNGTSETTLMAQLKELYAAIGITRPYPLTHAFHVLRHWGAHYWLAKKHYNHSLVAKIGGWHYVDELKKSYGEMPPEVVVQLLEDEDATPEQDEQHERGHQ